MSPQEILSKTLFLVFISYFLTIILDLMLLDLRTVLEIMMTQKHQAVSKK
jgi:hypothetical protein